MNRTSRGKTRRPRTVKPPRRNATKAASKSAASVASLKNKNALLTRELNQALEHQTATVEVLRVISRSTFDLQTVLDTLVESATRLCDADHAWLFQREGEFFRWVASYGHATDVHAQIGEYFKNLPVPVDRGSVTGRAALEARVVQVPDVLADPEYTWSGAQKIGGYRAALGAPLLREENVVGVIFVAKTVPEPFTAKQIELVSTFADQAVIAIENGRLLNDLWQREASLRDSEARYALVTEAATEGIYEWNIEGNDLYVSPRLNELFGFETGELTSQDWHGRVHPDERETYRRALVSHFKGSERHLHCEYRILIKSGEYRWVLDHGVAVRNKVGRAVRLVGSVSDISARKAAEMALRERTEDLVESLDQQTATSEVLGVISSSPGELQSVFQTILANATRLCEASFATLSRYDGNVFWVEAMRDVEPTFAAHFRQKPVPPDARNTLGRLLQIKQPVHIADITKERAYIEREPSRVAMAELAGARTLLAVPMLKEGKLLGAITIYRKEVRPFTDKQIALVTSFAAQAVIAIENARLLNELRESLEQQTATSEVLGVISSSPGDLEPVFRTMLASATRICEAKFGILFRYADGLFHPAALLDVPPAFADFLARQGSFAPQPDRLFGRLSRTKKVVHVVDRASEPNPSPSARYGGARSSIAVPMLKENELVGAFFIYRTEVRPFTDKQIELVQSFAAQAVIAIENARLLKELRQRTDDLSEALEQQTAIADILRVISGSAIDVQPVFETIVRSAVNLCGATYGIVFRYDGELITVAAHHNLDEAALEALNRIWPMRPDNRTVMGQTILERNVVHVRDMECEPNYTFAAAYRSSLGIRTYLAVPMLRDGNPIGGIALYRRDVALFSDRQIELVKGFADQAVIAVENARLLNELRESLEQQTATSEVLRVISSSPTDLRPVLDTLVNVASRLCGADDVAIFRLGATKWR
jgi:PAS domain S-box-containing protein